MDEVEVLNARIARAWKMVQRHQQRGSMATRDEWLQEWKVLCNKRIALTEVKP